MNNIFLTGFMGCGKSTVARYLSDSLGFSSAETDALISERAGMSIGDIFEKFGESYFRDLETEVFREIAGEKGKVISCGGGAVLRDENVGLMKKSGTVVLLLARPETVLERVKGNENRPLLKGRMNVESIREMMEERSGRYTAAADIMIHTDGKSVPEVCDEILSRVSL